MLKSAILVIRKKENINIVKKVHKVSSHEDILIACFKSLCVYLSLNSKSCSYTTVFSCFPPPPPPTPTAPGLGDWLGFGVSHAPSASSMWEPTPPASSAPTWSTNTGSPGHHQVITISSTPPCSWKQLRLLAVWFKDHSIGNTGNSQYSKK